MSAVRPQTTDHRPGTQRRHKIDPVIKCPGCPVRGPWSVVRGLAPHRSGFTLLELLVAASITVAMAGFIAIIVHNVSTTWTRASNRLGTDAQARIILDQLQLDLQGALFRDDGNVWLAADVLESQTGNPGAPWRPAQRNPKPAGPSQQMSGQDIAAARFGAAGVWLRFFTTTRGANTSTTNLSVPVAVGYQIVRRYIATNAQNLNTPYILHRVEVRPSTVGSRPGVLESGYSITAAAYTTGGGSSNNGGTVADPRTIQVVSTNPRGNLESIIGENVIDFGVRCYVRRPDDPNDPDDSAGLQIVFPAIASTSDDGGVTTRPGYRSSRAQNPTRLRSSLPPDTPLTAANFQDVYPDVVDVMVRILTDEGAAQIARLEQNQSPQLVRPLKYRTDAEWWWGVAMENSRVYTRRIVLNAEPL